MDKPEFDFSGLPPESCKIATQLLKKKRPNGLDVSRLLILNEIAVKNTLKGEGFLNSELIQKLNDLVPPSDVPTYNGYMNIYCILLMSIEQVKQFGNQFDLACELMLVHLENAMLENISPCLHPMRYNPENLYHYRIGSRPSLLDETNDKSIRRAWDMAKQALINCAIVKMKFKATGKAFKVPGLEAMLTSALSTVHSNRDAYNQAIQELEQNWTAEIKVPADKMEVIQNWFRQLPNYDDVKLPERLERESIRKITLANFSYYFDDMTDIFKQLF